MEFRLLQLIAKRNRLHVWRGVGVAIGEGND
jgi:hypothetical protein